MVGSISCVYETPCGWCSKWDKRCNKKQGEEDDIDNIRSDKIEHLCKKLSGFGIQMMDNNNNFRPVNEVLIDICKALRRIRTQCESKEEFEVKKQYLFEALVGVRYINELY